MALEILLWLSVTLNVFSLITSFFILKRFKKITKLTTLVYDQLVVSKAEPSENKSNHGLFDEALSQSLKKIESEAAAHLFTEDPLMERESTDPDDIHTKVMTKAEAHLVKVLQAKYTLHDGEETPPVSN